MRAVSAVRALARVDVRLRPAARRSSPGSRTAAGAAAPDARSRAAPSSRASWSTMPADAREEQHRRGTGRRPRCARARAGSRTPGSRGARGRRSRRRARSAPRRRRSGSRSPSSKATGRTRWPIAMLAIHSTPTSAPSTIARVALPAAAALTNASSRARTAAPRSPSRAPGRRARTSAAGRSAARRRPGSGRSRPSASRLVPVAVARGRAVEENRAACSRKSSA